MYGVVEFSVVPIGTGNTSVSNYVRIAYDILKSKNFKFEFHSMGTNVEGEIEEILKTIIEINLKFKELGVKRVVTSIKIDYRMDKLSKIEDKKQSVIKE